MNATGQFEELTPEDSRTMKSYVETHRTLSTPFDIVVEGKTGELTPAQVRDKLAAWTEAGATWWIEGLWELSEKEASERVQQGPPVVRF